MSSQIFNMPGRSWKGSLSIGYQEIKDSRIRVSPDGRRALLLGNQGSIFCVDLATRRTEKPRQLASLIRDGCFYDNDTCYFISGSDLTNS